MRIACTALSIVPWAVTNTTAIVCVCPAIRSSSSMPPMRGILRSVRTIEGDQLTIFSQPSCPSAALSVRYPQLETSSASPSRSFSSSSTISTFSWVIILYWHYSGIQRLQCFYNSPGSGSATSMLWPKIVGLLVVVGAGMLFGTASNLSPTSQSPAAVSNTGQQNTGQQNTEQQNPVANAGQAPASDAAATDSA